MPSAAAPSVPATLPDARSLFIRQHYSLTRLPVEPMPARRADARLGHFVTRVSDFGDERARSPTPSENWAPVWQGRRPFDNTERFVLYRRTP